MEFESSTHNVLVAYIVGGPRVPGLHYTWGNVLSTYKNIQILKHVLSNLKKNVYHYQDTV